MQRQIRFNKYVLSQSPIAQRLNNKFTIKTPISDNERSKICEIAAAIAKERGKIKAVQYCSLKAYYYNMDFGNYKKAARIAKNYDLLTELGMALEFYAKDILHSNPPVDMQKLLNSSIFILSNYSLFDKRPSYQKHFLQVAKKICIPIIENAILEMREPNKTFMMFLGIDSKELAKIKDNLAQRLRLDGYCLQALMIEKNMSKKEVQSFLTDEIKSQDHLL
jgi:hypothetical protein